MASRREGLWVESLSHIGRVGRTLLSDKLSLISQTIVRNCRNLNAENTEPYPAALCRIRMSGPHGLCSFVTNKHLAFWKTLGMTPETLASTLDCFLWQQQCGCN